nr:uncharacterized protein LOC115265263 [Aedes albopictus]
MKAKLRAMARKLAAEKAKTKWFKKKLKHSRKENKLLIDRVKKQSATDGYSTSGRSGSERVNLLNIQQNWVESIRSSDQEEERSDDGHDATDVNHETSASTGIAQDKPREEYRNKEAASEEVVNLDESRFLSNEDESRINFARNTTKTIQQDIRTNQTRATTSQDESRFLSSMNQLSVASINVPECKPSDDGDIHRQTFELWKDLLVDSMNLAGITDEATMFTVFKVKAGMKLLEIFRNTKSQSDDPDPQAEPFSNAMKRLKSYFGSGSDIMLMRRKLALMAQQVNETDLSFVTRVGSTARLCGYDEQKEFEEVAATIAEHAREREVRTTALRMLSKKGCFTDLVDKVREIESIRLNEEYVMRKQGKLSQAAVAVVTTSYQRQRKFPERYQTRNKPYVRPTQKPRTTWRPLGEGYLSSGNAGQARRKCWNCGTSHAPNDCFAKGLICNRCGIKGHIQRVCQAGTERGREQRMINNHEETPRIAAVGKSEDDTTDNEKVSENIES